MAAHRYWRLYVTAVDGSTSYASVCEFRLFADATGGTNLAIGKTASQSGDGAVGGASAAIDGNTGSEAGSSFSLPWWLAVDLGAGGAAEIKRVEIGAQRVVPNRSPKDFKIQWSDDGTNWTDQASFSSVTGWTEYQIREFAVVSYTVSGMVQQEGGAASRTVRLYRRDTGALLGSTTSNATTGAYSFTTAFNGEVQVVCLDDAAGTTYNDLIARTTPV